MGGENNRVREQTPIANSNDESLEDNESLVSKRMTIAGGFLDFALFVADVEHLKFIIETGEADVQHYKLLLSLLIASLTLQLIVGALLFIVGFKSSSNQTKEEAKWTRILNHVILGLVAIITICNIFVTTFGDRGETIYRFRMNHNCDVTSIPISYNQSEIFRT